MRFSTLQDWLAWQETLHPNAIDLGLDRVREVLRRLDWQSPRCPVITIAGTKGKGSSAALLECIYRHAGYRTGLFSSPHLMRYNERIRINSVEVSDAELCAVFARIDAARAEISLTYFEFNTLAALLLFAAAELQVWVLEVGMGGRLDAVNVVDPDVAVITSIGLDHTEWLGNDLNSIAREKAGIVRTQRPVIFGALDMPPAIAEVAVAQNAQLLRQGQDYGYTVGDETWSWWSESQQHRQLPLPGIDGAVQLQNASAVIQVIQCLQQRLPVIESALRQGLSAVRLAGRFQIYRDSNQVQWVLDVAHNAMSAQVLADHLSKLPRVPTLAILGVMADKDLLGITHALQAQVDVWLPTGLATPRALTPDVLMQRLLDAGLNVLSPCAGVAAACAQARNESAQHGYGRVLVCGSFLSVGPALAWLGIADA